MANYHITSEEQHDAAIERMLLLEQQPDANTNEELAALSDAVEAYEATTPEHHIEAPQTLRGVLEVEMFKRRIKQRQLAELLEVPEPRISEIMKGKREMNIDFARRLFNVLHVPADTILSVQG